MHAIQTNEKIRCFPDVMKDQGWGPSHRQNDGQDKQTRFIWIRVLRKAREKREEKLFSG